jgi:hypothetical protein
MVNILFQYYQNRVENASDENSSLKKGLNSLKMEPLKNYFLIWNIDFGYGKLIN